MKPIDGFLTSYQCTRGEVDRLTFPYPIIANYGSTLPATALTRYSNLGMSVILRFVLSFTPIFTWSSLMIILLVIGQDHPRLY